MSTVPNIKPLPRQPIHKGGNNKTSETTTIETGGGATHLEESQLEYEEEDDYEGEEVEYELYSDSIESEEYDEHGERSRSYSRDRFEMSRSCPRTPPRPPKRPNHRSKTPATTTTSFINESISSSSIPSSLGRESLKSDSKTNSYLLLTFFIAIVVVVLATAAACLVDYGNTKVIRYCSYDKLQESYPEQNNKTWRILSVGIESILNKRTELPAVYLLAHHGGPRIDKLVKDIAVHTSKCFDDKKQPIEMVHEDFTSAETKEDYGRAIEKFKKKIQNGNVILIANLNEIPPEAARAFHTICDTHSPIAKDVVIFLTLIIPENKETGHVEMIIEDTLIELWGSTLQRNELDPLITRVTDQVIALKD
ncbi:torsin interacting protein [Musca autumnalis]|uniref:torsin interacting protein n=1 Tax=Musca autumnalis TaxID=221902 RepID=UPI003CF8A5F8